MSTEQVVPEGAERDLATENARLREALAEVSNAAEIALGLLGDVKSRDETLRWIVERAKRV